MFFVVRNHIWITSLLECLTTAAVVLANAIRICPRNNSISAETNVTIFHKLRFRFMCIDLAKKKKILNRIEIKKVMYRKIPKRFTGPNLVHLILPPKQTHKQVKPLIKVSYSKQRSKIKLLGNIALIEIE